MATTIFLLILSGLLLTSSSYTRRKRSALETPIDKISAQANFNSSQFSGKWHVVAVSSQCRHLWDSSRKSEGVHMVVSADQVTPQGSMWIDTFYPTEGDCWLIKQVYYPTETPGRFLLTGRGLPVDIVVGETDYSTYAIIFYQKSQKISVKLYGRASRLSEPIRDKFDRYVLDVGLTDELTYYFRHYGFCHSASQSHILDETKSEAEQMTA
ncbi:complement component C8 gamma chain [Paroedura picta]|uniref:complement component C8 gamma chain n=1 Tax=Paroedura picta TaxID=143630 RepID=UPI00405761F4